MPGIFGIFTKKNDSNPFINLDLMLGSMVGILMHLPWYNVQKRIFKEAAFASISVSNNDKMFDLNYNGKKYVVLIDGQIYDIENSSYSSRQSPTGEQLAKIIEIATSTQYHNLAKIKGNYSIAVYCVDDHQLILFNDIIGPRRLYYADIDNVFTFSPEIKGICNLPEFKKEINWKAVADLLNFGYVIGGDTLFNSIISFPSASILNYSAAYDQPSSIRRYWTPTYTESESGDSEVVTQNSFLLLKQSIEEKIAGSETIISPISGGLDSRIILGTLIRDTKGAKINPVTYGQRFSYEYKNAQKVCNVLCLDNHQLVDITANTLLDKYLPSVWLSEGMVPATNCHLLLLPETLGCEHDRVLNGIYGGPTNYSAEYYASRHLRYNPSFEDRIKDIQAVISINSRYYNDLFSNRYINSMEDCAISSLSKEFIKYQGTSERFCNQRDAFFIENRMRRRLCQSALYRFFWEEHLPLSNYDLYCYYLSIPAEMKIGRQLLKSMLIKFFPELAKIKDANTGLNLFSQETLLYAKKKAIYNKLKHHITRLSGGLITFYDKSGYAHYGNWFCNHKQTYQLWGKYLFSEALLDLELYNKAHLESFFVDTRRGGYGFHHITRLTTFAMWYDLFVLGNGVEEVKNVIKKMGTKHRLYG